MKPRSILIVCGVMITLFACQAVALDIPTDGLVAYYSFDDGTANDNSGNGYDGTISVGSAVPVEGFYGTGLQFDGYDDSVRLPQLFTNNPRTITVVAFIKPDTSGTNTKTIFQNAHYSFALTIVPLDSDYANIRMGAALDSYSNWYRANTTIPMGTDTWYAVAGTVDTNYNNATIYINGTLKDKIPLPGNSFFYWNEGFESIGASDWAGGRVDKYRGVIDEVMIYNRTLSASEIAAICEDFINQPPLAQDDTYEVNQDEVLTVPSQGVLANDVDPEGDPLTASCVSTTINGDLLLNPDGSFTYTPLPDWFGNVTFTYKANDGIADSNEAEVWITVNKAPIPSQYVINTTVVGSGSISPSGDIIVLSGENQSFDLQSNKPYQLAVITIDDITIDLKNLVVTFNNVFSDHTISAEFTSPSNKPVK